MTNAALLFHNTHTGHFQLLKVIPSTLCKPAPFAIHIPSQDMLSSSISPITIRLLGIRISPGNLILEMKWGNQEQSNPKKESLPSRTKTISKGKDVFSGLGFSISLSCDMALSKAETDWKVLFSLV